MQWKPQILNDLAKAVNGEVVNSPLKKSSVGVAIVLPPRPEDCQR